MLRTCVSFVKKICATKAVLMVVNGILCTTKLYGRSHWPRGLRRRSTAAHLLRLLVRIPPGAWMFFCWECCVLSGTGLCDALITRPEESYRMWCVVVCYLKTSRMRRPCPTLGRSATGGKKTKIKTVRHSDSKVHFGQICALFLLHSQSRVDEMHVSNVNLYFLFFFCIIR